MASMTPSAPVYVQQTFGWDDSSAAVATVLPPKAETATTRVRPSHRAPVTVASVHSTSSTRRGRCEHVGGILASVLEKYGLTIDQLLSEIDGTQQ
jgi:hypothetical protein